MELTGHFLWIQEQNWTPMSLETAPNTKNVQPPSLFFASTALKKEQPIPKVFNSPTKMIIDIVMTNELIDSSNTLLSPAKTLGESFSIFFQTISIKRIIIGICF